MPHGHCTRQRAAAGGTAGKLDLLRRVEIHEVEERKNQHINDLRRNNDEAMEDMKTYYQKITNDSLEHIKAIQESTEELTAGERNNRKKVSELQRQNGELVQPLKEKETERAALENKLKYYENVSSWHLRLRQCRRWYRTHPPYIAQSYSGKTRSPKSQEEEEET
eukprot:GHVU01133240.1.p1 GENE.GHVU01133240.1~~GHVU01133240.1.p1  ORF type:complete len:165 (+),score=31.41 GHVU01133240.1:409-903(+)